MSINKTEPTPTLDDAIDDILTEMKSISPDTNEYASLVEHLTKLYKIKADMAPDRFSKDQMLAVAANLTGIVLILSFERTGPIISKAVGFLAKSKV